MRGAIFQAAKSLAILALLVLAGACTTQIRTQVTRFNHLPAVGNGETFAVVPIEAQASSLEWEQYAELVAQQLETKGYVRVPLAQLSQAKYGVLFLMPLTTGVL